MSALFLRALRRRPASNVNGAIRHSIARYESTVSRPTLESGKSNSAAIATATATDGLSRAASAAGPALKGISKTLGKVGNQTQHIISYIQGKIPIIIYYGRVGLEISKLVFHGQKMSPPPMSTFQSYFHRIFDKIRNPETLLNSVSAKNPQEILRQVRNLSTNELAAGAVLFAELLGFFTVGEIIGRFKLIGYRGKTAHHH